MAENAVQVAVDDFIATVTLDRPPVNAVDRATLIEIRDAFSSLNDRRDVRVAIFTAAGIPMWSVPFGFWTVSFTA